MDNKKNRKNLKNNFYYAVFCSMQTSLIIGTLEQSKHLFSFTRQPSPVILTSITLSHLEHDTGIVKPHFLQLKVFILRI